MGNMRGIRQRSQEKIRQEEIGMVELNEKAAAYMERQGWRHIVLNIEEITS